MKFNDRLVYFLIWVSFCFASWAAEGYLQRLPELVDINHTRNITDEEFFGKYDLQTGKWSIEPKLDYSFTVRLRPVEHLVRKGDYESAAAELLNYYRNRNFRPNELPKSWNAARVELWSDNIFGFDQQERVVGVLEISDKPKEYEIDVSGAIREGVSTYMFMGRNKNEKLSYISSRESKTSPPILELLIEGKSKRIVASADIYIRAGRYGNENYGGKDPLEICNSGVTSQQPFDDNTRRALISFNLPKIDLSSIKSAKLKINAWSENPSDKLIIWFSHPTVIDELKDTWNNSMGYQYSWEGIKTGVEWARPKGAHGQYPNWVRRMYWLPQMTAASIRGEDLELAKTTIALIRDFIADYADNPRNELNATGRVPYLCDCLPYLFDSDAMTARDCVEIIKFLWREGEYLLLNPSQLVRDNMDNMGIGLVATQTHLSANFPELADSKLWLADGYERTEKLMQHLVMNDGAYIEHTMGYPFPVLERMLDLIELCDKYSIAIPDSVALKTHQLAKYLMNVSFPDGMPPRWGEGNPRNTKTSALIKRAAEFFNDRDLKWWCGLSGDTRKPEYTSVHYPDAKIIVSRSGWEDDNFVMFFAPRAGGAHFHVDQNHISLYAYGRKLLVDTGMSSYSSSHSHFDWQRHQTKSHNTVEVDEQGYPRTGNRTNEGLGAPESDCKSEIFVSENLEYMKGYAAGYPNVEHNRSVMYLKQPGLYIVADVLVPNDDKLHTYDQCWHLHRVREYFRGVF